MDAQDLKSAGLKVTLPRLKILEILEKSDNHHMTAEDIYRSLVLQGEEGRRGNYLSSTHPI